MKKEYSVIGYLILSAVVLWLAWPHLRSGYAKCRSWFGRNSVVTGTANSGDDSGGVLTNVGG